MTFKGYLVALALSFAFVGGGVGPDHEIEFTGWPCDQCGNPSVTEATFPSRCDSCLDRPEEGGG